jgi:hypothetical protein
MSTRNGKIARLPRAIREQLNRRCDDGEPGKRLVEWLNSLPEVLAVLAAEFAGRPVSEQNLSEWKQGGYLDWQKQEEKRDWVRQLSEDADQLEIAAGDVELSNRLSVVLAAELGQAARQLLEETTDPQERWERLQEILRELARLRREDQKAGHLDLERQRWEQEQAKEEAGKHTARLLAPIYGGLIRDLTTELFNWPDPASQTLLRGGGLAQDES